MNEEKTYLSREKFKELEGELDYLKTTRRQEIAEKLEYAKSLGDLSENSEYQEAREAQANIEERIANIELLLRNAEIASGRVGDTVQIGSTVAVQKTGDAEQKTFHIVGSEEADMSQQKVSNRAPLGKALMGKSKGDAVTVQTPKGEAEYTILDVT